MPDPLLKASQQIGLMAAVVTARLEDTLEMIALHRNGHPRAQDFEPTGHGGSDPTSVNGSRPDKAVKDGRDLRASITRAHKEMVKALDFCDEYRKAIRPERSPEPTSDDWCQLHLQADVYNPRYRGVLCRPCVERTTYMNQNGLGELTLEQVRYHADPANMGRWPRNRIDPKARKAV